VSYGSRRALAVVFSAAMVLAVGCGAPQKAATDSTSDHVSLGFSQVGNESGWRAANTKSIQDAARNADVTLTFDNADQKQDAQIAAIRSYIKAKVDVIAFSPVVSSGWDQVLGEAKAAKIPVVITDRTIDTKDTSLYQAFIGSDFLAEGRKAGSWLVKEYSGKTGPVRIVELEGTAGSAPATDRKRGFADALAGESKFQVVASQTADFTRDKGKAVMASILTTTPSFDVLFAQNDDMGLGAMQALEAAGRKPGTDVKIITVDAIRDGLTALAAGQINYVVECSPLLGPQLMDVVKKIKRGETVPPVVVTEETTFDQAKAKTALPNRVY
jgi:ABC-type sugar transport system substrate-binding protein